MIVSKKIALAVWLAATALWATRLNNRIEIMFDPVTDGPIRYADQIAVPLPPTGACLTTIAIGPTAQAVYAPCTVTTGVSR